MSVRGWFAPFLILVGTIPAPRAHAEVSAPFEQVADDVDASALCDRLSGRLLVGVSHRLSDAVHVSFSVEGAVEASGWMSAEPEETAVSDAIWLPDGETCGDVTVRLSLTSDDGGSTVGSVTVGIVAGGDLATAIRGALDQRRRLARTRALGRSAIDDVRARRDDPLRPDDSPEERQEKIDRREAQVEAWQRTVDDHMATAEGIMGGNEGAGDTWHVALRLGGGFLLFPIAAEQSGADAEAASEISGVGGIAVAAALELWPWYGRYVGFGGLVEVRGGAMGTAELAMAGMETLYGVRAFAGAVDAVAIEGTFARVLRAGSYSDQVAAGAGLDRSIDGDADYQLSRLGVGILFCPAGGRGTFCDGQLAIRYARDVFDGDARTGDVYEVEFTVARMLGIGIGGGWRYPPPVDPLHPVDDPSESYINVRAEYRFDVFGDPYLAD